MTPSNLTELIQIFTDFAILTVPVLVALALLFFVWGLATFILNSGNKDEGKKGRDRMVWGLVALFVILSIGGLLSIIQNTIFPSSYGGHTQPGVLQPSDFEGGSIHYPPLVGNENSNLLNQKNPRHTGFSLCLFGIGSCE